MSAVITTQVLQTSLTGIVLYGTSLPYSSIASISFSEESVLYEALLHLEVASRITSAYVEAFQTVVAQAVTSSNPGEGFFLEL